MLDTWFSSGLFPFSGEDGHAGHWLLHQRAPRCCRKHPPTSHARLPCSRMPLPHRPRPAPPCSRSLPVAGADCEPGQVLPHRAAGDGARHPLLLGACCVCCAMLRCAALRCAALCCVESLRRAARSGGALRYPLAAARGGACSLPWPLISSSSPRVVPAVPRSCQVARMVMMGMKLTGACGWVGGGGGVGGVGGVGGGGGVGAGCGCCPLLCGRLAPEGGACGSGLAPCWPPFSPPTPPGSAPPCSALLHRPPVFHPRRRGPFQAGVPALAGARRPRPQDVQVPGQCHRCVRFGSCGVVAACGGAGTCCVSVRPCHSARRLIPLLEALPPSCEKRCAYLPARHRLTRTYSLLSPHPTHPTPALRPHQRD